MLPSPPSPPRRPPLPGWAPVPVLALLLSLVPAAPARGGFDVDGFRHGMDRSTVLERAAALKLGSIVEEGDSIRIADHYVVVLRNNKVDAIQLNYAATPRNFISAFQEVSRNSSVKPYCRAETLMSITREIKQFECVWTESDHSRRIVYTSYETDDRLVVLYLPSP